MRYLTYALYLLSFKYRRPFDRKISPDNQHKTDNDLY